MKRKYAKLAVALAAAAVTITSPGSYALGNSINVMAAEQTEEFQEIGTAAEFRNAVATGSGSYKLTADMGNIGNVTVPANSDLTIDLNGYSLKIHWNIFQSGSSLHLLDSSPGQTGTMSSSSSSRLFYLGSNVTLTIDSGNYVCEKDANTDCMFETTRTVGSQIVINGGNFRMNSMGSTATHAMFSNFIVANSQTVINGGTFSAADGTYVFRGVTNKTLQEALKNVEINGGTFGENTLDVKNQTPEGAKAYITSDGKETELSTAHTNIFRSCSSVRLTDDFLVNSVKLNGEILNGNKKEVTIVPDKLNAGNGDEGKNTLTVTDFEGVESTYTFYIDNVAPAVTATSVSPGNGQVYYGAKTFTFETSETIQSPGEGWTDVSEEKDGTKWAKEFTDNTKFTLTLTDLAGNTVTTKRYEVKNIETAKLEPQVTYSITDPTRDNVTVTIQTNVECKTPAGWKIAEGSSKRNLFQKVYTENTEETVDLVSLGGQKESVDIKISNIDREAPQIIGSISITPDNGQMSLEKVVFFEANESIVSPGEGWKEVEGSNGTKWQKVYKKAMKDSITLTDLAGNTSDPVNFEVKRIEDTALAAEVIYSNDGNYTNQDVTVTIKTNVECKTPEGWAKTGNKRNQFEKIFSADAEETVTLVSLAGQTINQQITVKGIDKVAPEAYVNGTDPIDDSVIYNDGVSLKFYDNAALDRYELNGQAGPTSIKGNKWGDGNLQNIKGVLVDGVNSLVVWDMAGNFTEYKFTVDLNIPQTVGVNYYIPAEDRYVEGKIVVDKDATTVDPTTLTDIPEGYELISTEPVQINDKWIYVELQKIVTKAVATLQVNFVGPFGEEIDVAPVVVTKTGPEGEWASFVYGEDWELPEGYTFAEKFDETAAKQIFCLKYGETLDTLEIGIVEK